MSAPSDKHERRRAFIMSIADLVGCVTDWSLDERSRPDVVRMDLPKGRLLIGEAKHTEDPSCQATRARLVRYASLADAWSARGFNVLFVVCHDRLWTSEEWAKLLVGITAYEPNLSPCFAGGATFDEHTAMTWLVTTSRVQRELGKQGGGSQIDELDVLNGRLISSSHGPLPRFDEYGGVAAESKERDDVPLQTVVRAPRLELPANRQPGGGG